MNLLIFVVTTWLGIVAIAVAVDAGRSYYADTKSAREAAKETKPKKIQRTRKVPTFDADETMKLAIAKYRQAKQHQIGVVFTIGQRPSLPRLTGGAHRRTKVAA